MADLSDVEVAIVGAAIAALYPNGLSQPSCLGSPIRIYRGWPLAGPLRNDLSAGTANLSVFSVPGSGRNTTRWNRTLSVQPGVASMSVIVAATTATFAGEAASGQVAGLLVDGSPHVYRTKPGDTVKLVAAAIGEMILLNRACSLVGESLTIPRATNIVGRVVADGTTETEWVRQSQAIRLSAWCPDPYGRDKLCSALGSALAGSAFLDLADGSSGRLRYRSTQSFDDHQDAQEYRRDLIYDAEFGTLSRLTTPTMLFGDLTFNDSSFYS